jgi:hypothetical protein
METPKLIESPVVASEIQTTTRTVINGDGKIHVRARTNREAIQERLSPLQEQARRLRATKASA